MNYSSVNTLDSRIASSTLEKYGKRYLDSTEIDRVVTYNGPNIRAFMHQQSLDPNKWPELLTYNRFGSPIDLVEGQSQFSIPTDL